MRRRRWLWLLAAVALLGAAAWLMARDDPEREPPVWQRVDLPTRMTREEAQRAELRKTYLPPQPPASPEAPPPRPQDPLLAALPSEIEEVAVVVEANAIRHSPVGELMIDCLNSRDDGQALRRFNALTGIDPLADLDRVALVDETMIITGYFQDAQWAELFPEGGVPFGQKGMLYQPKPAENGRPLPAIGVWDGQMVILGDTDEQVRAAMDRLEGRGLGGDPVLSPDQTFGEIYGVLKADLVAELVAEGDPALAAQIDKLADQIELHVDAASDVGVVAKVTGPDAQSATDLGRTLGAALALGRTKAQLDGEEDLAELLDLARVVPDDGSFRMELGLPLEVLERKLKECVARNRARNAAKPDAGR